MISNYEFSDAAIVIKLQTVTYSLKLFSVIGHASRIALRPWRITGEPE